MPANQQTEIFFSYAWGGETEQYALDLYSNLQAAGYNGIIDRNAVGYKESFTDFMKRIGKGSFVILLVNDKYLKSDFCMLEFLEIYRKSSSELSEMGAKLFPVVFGDAKLRNLNELLEYAGFWEKATQELEAKMTGIGLKSTVDVGKEYKAYSEISANITELAKWLRSHNTLTPEKLAENGFAIIKTAIAERQDWLTRHQAIPTNLQPKRIGTAPFILNDSDFVGRSEELTALHEKLFSGQNILLLVNGEGGVGKTSLAARYYIQYSSSYHYTGWVTSQKSIANALLLLAPDLGIEFAENATTDERLQQLVEKMAKLPRPSLLVIDNANELEDLEANYIALGRCSNFHLLLTSRLADFEGATAWPVGGLPLPEALELFTKYYPGHTNGEDDLFAQIHEAVNSNTLVIELMAKNLMRVNHGQKRYTLADLLADLQQRGLLAISQSTEVTTTYHATGIRLRKEKPEVIIAAMYDMEDLAGAEKRVLTIMAVLPAENIAFATLQELLPATTTLAHNLLRLAQTGWLAYNLTEQSYKISPVVQDITRKKNTGLLQDCDELLDTLIEKLRNEGDHLSGNSFEESELCAYYASAVLANSIDLNFKLTTLYQILGNYHRIIGNLPVALQYFECCLQYCELLHKTYPDNIIFEVNWSVSYGYIGQIYTSLGSLDRAMECYEKANHILLQTYEAHSDNAEIKINLADSYQKIGGAHAVLGNLSKALQFYDRCNQLFQELEADYPDDMYLKHSIALFYARVGKTYTDIGNPQNTLAFYEKYNLLMKQVYADHPGRMDYKYTLANSYALLGGIYATLGNLDTAIQLYEPYAQAIRELYAAYPYNVAYKNELAIAYAKFGEVLISLGNLNKALEYSKDSNTLLLELYEDFPDKVAFKQHLAASYEKLGQISASLGNLPDALRFYELDTQLTKELYDVLPDNVDFKNSLAISYDKMGETYFSMNNRGKAMEFYKKRLHISKELCDTFPDAMNFKYQLAIAYEKMGHICLIMGQFPDAMRFNTDQLEIFKELCTAFPDNVNYKFGLALAYQKLAQVNGVKGNLYEALRFSKSQMDLFEQLYESNPNSVNHKNAVAVSYMQFGTMHLISDKAKARHYFTNAKKIWTELVADAPDNAQFKFFLDSVGKTMASIGP